MNKPILPSDWGPGKPEASPADFFMVFREGAQRPPKIIHVDEISAAREANRLASYNPGKQFVVLRAVAIVETPPL